MTQPPRLPLPQPRSAPNTPPTTGPSQPATAPAARVLSLGAGRQSSTLLMLSAEGAIPKYDWAVFADTGWETKQVYKHLDELEAKIARPANIPIHRVNVGNIRHDALDPKHRFASMPLHVLNRDGTAGMIRRQCTSEYKLKPIKANVRLNLGAPVSPEGRVGRVPRGRYVLQSIGISTDEFTRAKPSGVQYAVNVFPLLDLGMSAEDCVRFLQTRGWGATPRSACVGCPFHGNATWRDMRDNRPDDWADAVAFDHAIRAGNARGNENGKQLLGQAFLHRSLMPLDEAPLDGPAPHRPRRHRATPPAPEVPEEELEEGDPDGCSPWGCRSGSPVQSVQSLN
ncbi:hypothetical protein [Embleya sp. NBC_00896]|uniref:hypothetical protein n=1 Tax=Embleya sp. NBC_00896 TaxID=2975961 RepID=UPI002F91803C|nr:hypothetical protein OG928_48365 [Embleya sp. NBC_00896]